MRNTLKLHRLTHLGAVAAVLGWTALAVAPAQAQDEGATLVIHVHNISPKGGVLRLGLYDQARYPDDDAAPVASADVKVEAGENVITLTNILPGTYAIQTFQDINGNNKMDTSWLGLPLEPFGFSRDAQPRLSKPRFAAVKFDLAPGLNVQSLHLQNSVSLLASK
jgi:uncharacterized protein (DUF2141 family)